MPEAARLQESEVAEALREMRRSDDAPAPTEAEVHAIYAAEEQRVAEAAALAELLLPRLIAGLNADAHPGGPRSLRLVPVPAPAESRAPAPPGGPPAIPDLLDAMLAAERTGRRSAAPVSREP